MQWSGGTHPFKPEHTDLLIKQLQHRTTKVKDLNGERGPAAGDQDTTPPWHDSKWRPILGENDSISEMLSWHWSWSKESSQISVFCEVELSHGTISIYNTTFLWIQTFLTNWGCDWCMGVRYTCRNTLILPQCKSLRVRSRLTCCDMTLWHLGSCWRIFF